MPDWLLPTRPQLSSPKKWIPKTHRPKQQSCDCSGILVLETQSWIVSGGTCLGGIVVALSGFWMCWWGWAHRKFSRNMLAPRSSLIFWSFLGICLGWWNDPLFVAGTTVAREWWLHQVMSGLDIAFQASRIKPLRLPLIGWQYLSMWFFRKNRHHLHLWWWWWCGVFFLVGCKKMEVQKWSNLEIRYNSILSSHDASRKIKMEIPYQTWWL